MQLDQWGERARRAFYELRRTTSQRRNAVLLELASRLEDEGEQAKVLFANARDMEEGVELSSALKDRLRLDKGRLLSIARSVREIAALTDPVGEIIQGHRHPSGMEMVQKRVPLGVLFVIFESRPNVTIDIAALALKSGNAAILRGGKEALHSNVALYGLIAESLKAADLHGDSVLLVTDPARELMLELLKQSETIDLVVPRGGEGLIRYVSEHSRIPVVKHDKGVCTLFVDRSARLKVASEVAINAKLQRPSVCNAIENLVLHRDFPHKKELFQELLTAGADLAGCAETRAIDPRVRELAEDEYGLEYLDSRLSLKIVSSVTEAVQFIRRYGSGHSEAIIAEDREAIEEFLTACDSAALFVNCSTRFHDGGEMGMGAEVGISTGRMHVRGPMGLTHLTTTTWIVQGNGQIRS